MYCACRVTASGKFTNNICHGDATTVTDQPRPESFADDCTAHVIGAGGAGVLAGRWWPKCSPGWDN